MLQKTVGFAAIALTTALLLVPDATFARGGGIGGFHGGGLRAPFFSSRAAIRRAPFMAHTGARPLFRAPSTLPPPVAVHLPVRTHVATPFSHLARRHHGGFHNGWLFPVTVGDDFSYIGTPYDPGETIPVYGPAPAIDPVADPPAPRPIPRLTSARDESQDACRSERVTVPAGEGEREITVVRC